MRLYFFIAAIIAFVFGLALWAGAQPERRYESAECQHRMIYDYEPDQAFGLVTVGGSRVRYATKEREFTPVLSDLRANALPTHNLAHSRYSLGKEYVLTRDFLEQHSPKSMIVMIEPRNDNIGTIHPSFIEIARLRDIPLAVSALWPENRTTAMTAVRGIIMEHLGFFDRAGEPSKNTTVRDCGEDDARLDILALDRSREIYNNNELSQSILEWDLEAPEEAGFLRWMSAFKKLADDSETEIMFLLVSGTLEPLPARDMEQRFEAKTGMPLITFDADIHRVLAYDGKRDSSHINEIGRKVFLPWLIARIEQKCRREDGCL